MPEYISPGKKLLQIQRILFNDRFEFHSLRKKSSHKRFTSGFGALIPHMANSPKLKYQIYLFCFISLIQTPLMDCQHVTWGPNSAQSFWALGFDEDITTTSTSNYLKYKSLMVDQDVTLTKCQTTANLAGIILDPNCHLCMKSTTTRYVILPLTH